LAGTCAAQTAVTVADQRCWTGTANNCLSWNHSYLNR